jgi:glucosyl-dolichyl phosphate glucuronosyltransferase
MTTPLLSVIICTYNRAWLLRKSLLSLSSQTLAPALYEVVVIDNNSTDETSEVVKECQESHSGLNLRCVKETQQGLSFARNRGYQEARGKIVAYLDDDAIANQKWCEATLAAFEQPSVLAAGGPIVPWYEAQPPAWFDNSFETRSWGKSSKFLDNNLAKFGFSGGCMAFPKTILEQYAGFDTNLGMKGNTMGFAEEDDLFLRIWNDHQPKPMFWYETQMQIEHYTPERNWQVAYRKQRAFRSGFAMATITKATLASLVTWQIAASLAWWVVLFPLKIFLSPAPKQTTRVKALQKIAYRLGFLKKALSF